MSAVPQVRRVAMISVHTSPLEQPGTGDAGGLNAYVVEVSKRLAQRGIEVEILTRMTDGGRPIQSEIAPGVHVRNVIAGPFEGLVPLVHTMHTMARVKNARLAEGDTPEPPGREIGDERLRAPRELAYQLGIQEQVRFVPPVDRATFALRYRAADLVTIPSYSESFGLVAVEAQACGTPVVAAAVDGLPCTVGDGGLLIEGHRTINWSTGLEGLLDAPRRRDLLSRKAVEHASYFSWERTTDRLLEVYAEFMIAAASSSLDDTVSAIDDAAGLSVPGDGVPVTGRRPSGAGAPSPGLLVVRRTVPRFVRCQAHCPQVCSLSGAPSPGLPDVRRTVPRFA